MLHEDGVFAFRTGRQQGDRTTDELLDSTHVFYRLCGQLRPGTCTRCGLFPTLNGLIDRLDPGLRLFAGGQVIDLTAVKTITDANLDLVESVEDVQFCQRQTVNSACPHGLPDEHCVEPAAATRPPRDRTEFSTTLAERLPDRIVHLVGREWPQAHAGGVGLANAEHVIDRVRAEAWTRRGLRGPRGR